MADLVLGPLLRWVDRTAATVWVEADRPCVVDVLGHTAQTFAVGGHHYALVVVDLGDRDEVTPYEVRLDGEVAWPLPDDPRAAPVIRKPSPDRARIVFGSCRAAAPDTEPWSLPRSEDPRGYGVDALEQYAGWLAEADHDRWPDLLLLLGDQVYADSASPETRAFARSRRDTGVPPYEDVADLEEYTRLYRESWSDPGIRWLLATLPSAMVFDDHDIIDDWNISASWVADARAEDWWHDRIVGGLAAYWLYQHLGNLSPAELDRNELFREVREAEGDAEPILRRFAEAADRDPTVARWSFARELADTDLVVIDARAARVLGDGQRDMLDESEWEWVAERLASPAPNLLVATTLPVLLPRGINDVEAWNERLCDGAWGTLGRKLGEGLRRAVDLGHWAAFSRSQERLLGLLRGAVEREDVRHVAVLAGDVHNGSIDRATWDDLDQPLWQVVSSPLRQEIEPRVGRAFAFGRSALGRATGSVLRRLSGASAPALSWRTLDGPVLNNHVAVLDLGREAHVRFLTAGRTSGLEPSIARTLTAS